MERTTRSSAKRRKQIAPSIDRFSTLPDDVVCHILSFLPTKLSMATSVLARRWRSLWAHVPNLDFKREHFKCIKYYYGPDRDPQHSDIIHRVMWLHRSENMNSFSLSHISCTTYQLETWIAIAIERNVRNLDLRLTDVVMLPRHIFTCKTLVDLKLVCCANGNRSDLGTVSLPSLKKLHLGGVRYEFDEDLPHMLSGCPVLEELIIDEICITDEDSGCLYISSPTIKRLTVNFPFEEYVVDNPNYRVIINAPALRYLKVEDCSDESTLGSFKHISVSLMTSLIEADIYLHSSSLEEDDCSTHSAVKFLNCLSNVKCLKLSGPYPEKFLDVAVGGPVLRFDNLSKLELKLDVDWCFVAKLLEIADNLAVLTIGVYGAYWMEPKKVPTCVSSRLRTIRIDGSVCTQHGLNMVRYFLRKAEVLERMEIFSRLNETDFKGKFDAIQRISLFERGSKACQLAFY